MGLSAASSHRTISGAPQLPGFGRRGKAHSPPATGNCQLGTANWPPGRPRLASPRILPENNNSVILSELSEFVAPSFWAQQSIQARVEWTCISANPGTNS